jgi:3-oxoacyl-[acyl-carrier protein] reductase
LKVAIVTGGGRGLGRAFAEALAAAGYAVAVMARTTAELAETVALITRSGGKASAFPADVADAVAVDRAFTDIALAGADRFAGQQCQRGGAPWAFHTE